MADKLTYKGGTKVVNCCGAMRLVRPAGGASFHRFPQWWSKKGTVKYVDAAIIKVTLDNGEQVRLVLPNVSSTYAMTVEIRHDGKGNFTFPKPGSLERVAVVGADSTALLVEYQFSKISGGSVLKRTISALPEPAVVEPEPQPEPEPEPEVVIEEEEKEVVAEEPVVEEPAEEEEEEEA